jgi:hypothetical protein
MEETEKIDCNQQSKYSSGMCILLYLIKFSRPYLSNALSKLGKGMDGANLAAYKEMLCSSNQ